MFTAGNLSVRPISKKDAVLIHYWMNDNRVLEFYEGRDRPHTMDMVREHFISKEGEPVHGCIVSYEGRAIGYIQYYLVSDEEMRQLGYRVPASETIYGIDQFLGAPEFWNRGIGTQLVTAMTDYLFVNHNATRVIMDPQVRNARALRCYEKCGFSRVKLLPRHELHEGALQDCWLVEKRRDDALHEDR